MNIIVQSKKGFFSKIRSCTGSCLGAFENLLKGGYNAQRLLGAPGLVKLKWGNLRCLEGEFCEEGVPQPIKNNSESENNLSRGTI